MEFLRKLWSDEEGQGMVEYGLIIALISIVVIGMLALVGDDLKALFKDVSDTLS